MIAELIAKTGEARLAHHVSRETLAADVMHLEG